MRRWGTRLAAVAMVGVLVGAGFLAHLPFAWTPPVVAAGAPAAVFSAERAMVDVRAVASSPRSMGTPEHEAALTTIRGRLSSLGVESEIVEAVSARPGFGQVFVARTRNVIARIPGTDSTGAVALLSHFDSLPTSPNANDGGLGVATALETVRAVRAGPPLRNDLLLWFGDADETTALNAPVLQRHRWFRDVRVGFAFEAVGVHGPSVLTYAGHGVPDVPNPDPPISADVAVSLSNPQLSPADGRWLREALDAVPHPVVALPLNDIALGVSPDLGMSMGGTAVAGVSFSQIGDSSGYHTDLDDPDHVAPGSLQHSGETALALTQRFGTSDLAAAPAQDGLVVVNTLPGRVLAYPVAWAVPLALLAVAGLGGALVAGKRRGRLTVTGVLVGVGLTLVGVVASVAVALVLSTVLAPQVHHARNPYGAGWRMLALSALTVATVAGVFLGADRWLGAGPRRTAIAAGPLVVLAVLAVLTAVTLPALSHVFLWPTLGGAALLVATVLPPARARPWAAAAGLAVVGALVAWVTVPLVYLIGSGTSVSLPAFAAVIAACTALLAGALVPHLRYLGGVVRSWAVPLGLLVAAGAFVAAGLPTYGPDQPRPDHIQYTLDADTGTATWLSAGTGPDAWTAQFFTDGHRSERAAFSPGYYFGQEFDVITADAPTVDLPAPELTILDDATADGVRTVRLRIGSPRGAPMVHADLTLPGELVAAAVDGRALVVDAAAPVRRLPIAAYNPGPSGVEVTIAVRGTGPITGVLTDHSNGLPVLPGMTVSERPVGFMPAPFDFRDPTVVGTRVQL